MAHFALQFNNVAAEWLAELGAATTPRAAKTLLREKTEQQKGLRPGVGPAEVRGE